MSLAWQKEDSVVAALLRRPDAQAINELLRGPGRRLVNLHDVIQHLKGRTQFATDADHHGLQLAHDMVLAQWQTKNGKLAKEMVWPEAAATAKVVYPLL